MKRTLITLTSIAAIALSASIVAATPQSRSQIQKKLMRPNNSDLISACVSLKSGNRICGLFTRGALVKTIKASKGDIDWSHAASVWRSNHR